MKAARLPHLRTLHRFDLAVYQTGDGEGVRMILRPRGFWARLCTIDFKAEHFDNARDIRDFFFAVRALANTPPPASKRRKARRK